MSEHELNELYGFWLKELVHLKKCSLEGFIDSEQGEGMWAIARVTSLEPIFSHFTKDPK